MTYLPSLALLLAGVLLCPACSACYAQQPAGSAAAAESPLQFTSQRTIIYPVADPGRLPEAIAWYSAFFGKPPTQTSYLPPYPYAVFAVDGIEVRLESDPQYARLREPIFYWLLPTPADVEKKFDTLKSDPQNRFVGTLRQKMRRISDSRADNAASRSSASPRMLEVKEFVVVDPFGNQIGVVNNPVYPPTLQEQ